MQKTLHKENGTWLYYSWDGSLISYNDSKIETTKKDKTERNTECN